MAFSLGNIVKSAANTLMKTTAPLYGAASSVYGAAKQAIGALTQPKAPTAAAPTSSPANSLFSTSGNGQNGYIANNGQPVNTSIPSASAGVPATTQISITPTLQKLSTAQSPTLSSSTPMAALAQPTQTPAIPATIPSTTLTPGVPGMTTVPAPSTTTPSVVPFSPTTVAPPAPSPSPTAPGGTPPAAPLPGTSSVDELLNPSSDAGILATQKRITDVSTQLQGKAGALQQAQAQAKVPEYQQQLNDVMSQINTLNNEAVAQQVKIEGKPIASEFQSRQIGAVERVRVVKMLGLSAVASALQGNLSLANDYAQKAVDAKFGPLEAELTTLREQLDFNKDNFTRAEQVRASKLEVALQDRQNAIADAKEKQQSINALALEAAKNGADAQTLNSILNSPDLTSALGTARASLAKSTGMGVYGLSEAQANVASKLADDFEKASGTFSQVRDAYGKIQAAQQGTGISDTALIFAYMKMLDPGSVVREGEFATVQNAGGVGQKLMQAYNSALNGQKLPPSVRSEILNTSGSLFNKAQETQNVITSQYNDRAVAYGIPVDLVTRDISAGIGGAPTTTSGATPETIYAKLKAKYPTASEEDLQSVTQQYISNPQLQAQLGFTNDPGTSVNGPTATSTPSGTGFRTDRHNNPTAFTTDVARAAGLRLGVDYAIGDPFPNNASLKTAKLIGDPIATTIKVIDNIGFQTASGKPRWDYISIPKSQWNALSYDQKKQIIARMYQHEGGNQLSGIFA